MRYFISISYNGSKYSGWQIQQNGITIQGAIETALSVQLKEMIKIVGAGRTDAQVNGTNYIAHFDSGNMFILNEPVVFLYKINAILPPEIVVTDIFSVSDTSHARFDAIEREYKYFIHLSKDPFVSNFSYFCKYKLDIDKMNLGAKYIIGKKDFSCFEKLHSNNMTSICDVKGAFWTYSSGYIDSAIKSDHLIFTISANRFLRNMVRAIVGSLIEVGRGREEPQWIEELIENKKRNAAAGSVPGHALFLTKISYPYSLISLLNNNKIQ